MVERKFVPIIVGRGKLASEVIDYCKEIGQEYNTWNKDLFYGKDKNINYVVLYASNADKFIEVFDFCQENEIPLINGCTDVIFKKNLITKGHYQLMVKGRNYSLTPRNLDAMIINAPNWDLPIVGWMAAMKKYGNLIAFNADEISIKESHQASKKSTPGTAKNFAKGLGLPIENIFSERDPCEQRLKWRIEPEYLDGHACHEINITYKDSLKKTGFYTRVMGRRDYAKGGVSIAKKIAENFEKLDPGVYTIEDLVDLEIF